MASCGFSIEFSESAESLVARARQAILKATGTFEGNVSAGSFAVHTPIGKVKGSYTTNTSSIHIHIDQKPMLLGCDRIEKELRNYLAAQA
jgi:hypothetical protein